MLFIHRHYRNSGTSSFLEHYSQRLSAANVMHGAAEGLKAISRAAKDRIARKRRSDHGVCEARVGSRALMDAPVDTVRALRGSSANV